MKARAAECCDDGRTGKGVSYSIVYGFGWGQRVETAGRGQWREEGWSWGFAGLRLRGWVHLMFSRKNNSV